MAELDREERIWQKQIQVLQERRQRKQLSEVKTKLRLDELKINADDIMKERLAIVDIKQQIKV